jgi:hypothetical protein
MPSQGVPGDLTERLLRRFLMLCESPRTQRRVLGLVRASVDDAGAGRRFYTLVNKLVVHPVARAMRVETSAIRMELVGSQLIGLAMIRYVLQVEPIASLDIDDLVPLVAPPLRQVLTGRSEPAPALEVCGCRSSEPAAVPW